MKTKSYFYNFLLLIVICVGTYAYYLNRSVIAAPTGEIYYLKPGTSKHTFLRELNARGIVSFPLLLNAYIYLHPFSQLKTGEYLFPRDASLVMIWRQVTTGRGLVYHSFTIIPGWSFKQLRNALQQKETLRHDTVSLDDKTIMSRLGASSAPEGQFFPETYFYSKNTSDLVILQRAYQLLQKRLQEAWLERINNLPFQSPYEALIAASIIEKEAYLEIERPIIAGVLINRLKKGMLLQFDPTVIYGLGERFDGNIRKIDLTTDTPYNTYLHKGLPPTPIAMPSNDSIVAVLQPKQHAYLYFVAKGDGSHQFSTSLNAHHVAVLVANQSTPTAFINVELFRVYLLRLINAQLHKM